MPRIVFKKPPDCPKIIVAATRDRAKSGAVPGHVRRGDHGPTGWDERVGVLVGVGALDCIPYKFPIPIEILNSLLNFGQASLLFQGVVQSVQKIFDLTFPLLSKRGVKTLHGLAQTQ